MTLALSPTTVMAADQLAAAVAGMVAGGDRFAGLVASAQRGGGILLRALVAKPRAMAFLESRLAPGQHRYRSLTPLVPPAAWYEREIHDLFGLEPVGHPRLDPLVLTRDGGGRAAEAVETEGLVRPTAALPAHVRGEGVFTIPYGPVRSGVFESIEYLVETVGEDIVHLRTRVYHKHRGVDRRFTGLSVEDGALLAERVEGTTSVAHAVAFCQALEHLAGVEPPRPAELVRVVHAELERVANHLDSMIRHCEGAGQAVAYARLSLHKERVMRLRGRLCGHRFGRGVVVPGGVGGQPHQDPGAALAELDGIEGALGRDVRALMATPSFLDRLRTTGRISPEAARRHGALGPLGRASGLAEDVRAERPYGAYRFLGFQAASPLEAGDALARQQVRIEEMGQAFHLVRQGLDELDELGPAGPLSWRTPLPPPDGAALSSVESPQGELLYLVEIEEGVLIRVKPRTASFHNLALFPAAFQGDIFTDFVFIEASFGLSVAGVAG